MKYSAKHRQDRRKSPVYSYKTTIQDSEGGIEVRAYANAAAHIRSQDVDPILVQFNPGAFATRLTTGPLAKSLIRLATEDGQAMQVLVHRPPAERNANLPRKRIARFGRVAMWAAEAGRFEGQPQHVLGHSWAWSDSAQIVNLLRKPPLDPGDGEPVLRFGGMVGLTPNGHPPVPNRRGIFDLPGELAREVIRLPRAFPLRRPGSLAVGAALFGSILRQSLRHPVQTGRAIHASFTADVTKQVADITDSMDVAAVFAGHDVVSSAETAGERLLGAGVKPEDIIVVPGASHLSMVTDYQRTAEYLYPLLKAQHLGVLATAAAQAT